MEDGLCAFMNAMCMRSTTLMASVSNDLNAQMGFLLETRNQIHIACDALEKFSDKMWIQMNNSIMSHG